MRRLRSAARSLLCGSAFATILLYNANSCTFKQDPDPDQSPWTPPAHARPEVHAELLADRAAPRHPADGAGRVERLEGPAEVQVGTRSRWRFALTLGPAGVAAGGVIVFQPPPFWGWSPPQVRDPEAPGYVTVEAPAGAEVAVETPGAGLLAVRAVEALPGGATLRLGYGDGPGLAAVDRYAGGGDAFWFGVDGDGDGVRGLLEPVPVAVKPGPPARLLAWLPSTAQPGQQVTLRVSWVDAQGNHSPAEGELHLEGNPALGLPPVLEGSGGLARLRVTPATEGVMRVLVRAEGLPPALSNPMVVRAGAPRLIWADLQVHTALSDGSATPEEALAYGRDVAGLDAVAITDHDRWGMRALDSTPGLWERVQAAARQASTPEFLGIAGYEWTSWLWGHRHVLYLGPPGPLFSALDPTTDTPAELWAALRGQPAVTLAHHSAGGPVATDWRWAPDPVLEPVTELCSVHGSSEAPDTPGGIYDPVPGNTVREQLARGLRLGFVCSTDGHDGHPGLSQLAGPHGGLAAIWSETLSPEGLLEALRARRVYGTNGARILLRTTLSVAGAPEGEGLSMGAALPAPAGPLTLTVRVVAPAPVAVVELVRGPAVVETRVGGQEVGLERFVLEDLQAGEPVYVRVRDVDGGVAWSSPYFVGGG